MDKKEFSITFSNLTDKLVAIVDAEEEAKVDAEIKEALKKEFDEFIAKALMSTDELVNELLGWVLSVYQSNFVE